MTIILDTELASYLGEEITASLTFIAELTNDVIEEEWQSPVEPVPNRIRALALTVAARAGSNPKGLTSWTRSWDDVSRTERVESARQLGVYLTDDEKASLNATEVEPVSPIGTIHTPVRGWPACW